MSNAGGPSTVDEVVADMNKVLWQYWQELAAAWDLPRKAAVNPVALKRALPHLAIYERRADDDFRLRLVGTQIVERLGVDLTGRNLLEFLHYAAKDQAREDLNRVLDDPSGQFLLVKDRFSSGRQAWVEILRLPLADARGEPRFIIGCTTERRSAGYHHKGTDQPELVAERLAGFFFDATGGVRVETVFGQPCLDKCLPA
jgi:hypothetical protein